MAETYPTNEFFGETLQLSTVVGIVLITVAGILVVASGEGAEQPKSGKFPEREI